MASIIVKARPLAWVPGIGSYYHCYLLAVHDDGTVAEYHAFPSDGPDGIAAQLTGALGIAGINADQGVLTPYPIFPVGATSNIYSSSDQDITRLTARLSDDFDVNNVFPSIQVWEGSEALLAGYIAKFDSAVTLVRNMSAPYNALFNNSNSFINTLLGSAQLPQRLPVDDSGTPIWAPGFTRWVRASVGHFDVFDLLEERAVEQQQYFPTIPNSKGATVIPEIFAPPGAHRPRFTIQPQSDHNFLVQESYLDDMEQLNTVSVMCSFTSGSSDGTHEFIKSEYETQWVTVTETDEIDASGNTVGGLLKIANQDGDLPVAFNLSCVLSVECAADGTMLVVFDGVNGAQQSLLIDGDTVTLRDGAGELSLPLKYVALTASLQGLSSADEGAVNCSLVYANSNWNGGSEQYSSVAGFGATNISSAVRLALAEDESLGVNGTSLSAEEARAIADAWLDNAPTAKEVALCIPGGTTSPTTAPQAPWLGSNLVYTADFPALAATDPKRTTIPATSETVYLVGFTHPTNLNLNGSLNQSGILDGVNVTLNKGAIHCIDASASEGDLTVVTSSDYYAYEYITCSQGQNVVTVMLDAEVYASGSSTQIILDHTLSKNPNVKLDNYRPSQDSILVAGFEDADLQKIYKDMTISYGGTGRLLNLSYSGPGGGPWVGAGSVAILYADPSQIGVIPDIEAAIRHPGIISANLPVRGESPSGGNGHEQLSICRLRRFRKRRHCRSWRL